MRNEDVAHLFYQYAKRNIEFNDTPYRYDSQYIFEHIYHLHTFIPSNNQFASVIMA